ncbi:MAG: MotA/TolQ/ExbB proton channel family protein [Deltaproteobacteria bacterium]|nr:MotA/TolQ/ExbB proton channel family protein [Deltaproteobacteria bacterium]
MTRQLFDALTRAGAEWVLYALMLLSVASVAVILERWIFFLRHGRSRGDELLPLLAAGDAFAARERLRGQRGLEARVVEAALDAAEGGPASVAERVACAVRRERPAYERGMGFLATLGSNAPFLGLFGTVVGIIKAFADLGVGSAQNAGATAVMAGLSEALVATAVGIFVAIPAVAAFNAFSRRLRTLVSTSEALAHALASHLARDDVRALALARARASAGGPGILDAAAGS